MGLVDAFRHKHGNAREFTRIPRGAVASQTNASRRLDRAYVSQRACDGLAAPIVRRVWHVAATDQSVAPRYATRDGILSKPSDHGAVALTICFSNKPKPPTSTSYDAGLLLDHAFLEQGRATVTRHVGQAGTGAARMDALRTEALQTDDAFALLPGTRATTRATQNPRTRS